MAWSSLFSPEALDSLLAIVRENVQRDGFLQTMLMIKTTRDADALPIALPDDPQQKRAYLYELGAQLHQQGQLIIEAVVISEGWAVHATNPADFTVPPSQHPAGQKAIVLVGQNANATQKLAITQSFQRIGDKLEWQPVSTSTTVLGHLDAFFLGNQGGVLSN